MLKYSISCRRYWKPFE